MAAALIDGLRVVGVTTLSALAVFLRVGDECDRGPQPLEDGRVVESQEGAIEIAGR